MKKTIALLIIAMVLSMSVSCENQTTSKKIIEETSANNVNDNLTTAEEILKAEVPEKDYKDYEFRIIANSKAYNTHWYSRDIDAEQENGDLINDAVFRRNSSIEEKYNIKITGIFSANPAQDAKKSISAGDNAYDLISTSLLGIGTLIQENMLIDLETVPYVDLNKPWWDSFANEQLSIDNKLYATVNDLLVMDKDAVFVFFFSKDMIKEYSLENPYELVRNGKWTLDKMYSMAKVVAEEINGDGIWDEKDKYGLVSQTHSIGTMLTLSGEKICKKDVNDKPYLSLNSPRAVDTFIKLMEIHNNSQVTITAQDMQKKYPGDTVWDEQLKILDDNRSLFQYTGMNRVTLLRSMDCNFGIIPNPKFDDAQDKYYNAPELFCSSSIAIPTTATDIERTGIILEALTAESYYTLRPAYYDLSLKTKLLRDDESSEMLDLIFSSRVYDLGQMYNWGGLYDQINSLAVTKKTDFSSTYAKREKIALDALEKTWNKITQND